MPSTVPELPSIGMDVLESREVEELDQLYLTLEEAGLMDDPNEPSPEETALTLWETDDPQFDNGVLVQTIVASQSSTDSDWVNHWSDSEDFIQKRHGLLAPSDQQDDGQDATFPMRLGLPNGPVDLVMVALFESLTNSRPLPRECDLSPECDLVDGEFQFPHRSPDSVLHISRFEESYLVTVGDHPWKLLINDPLTLIQIEREGWHLQYDGLISNLVRKGLPFEILFPSCQNGTAFYTHPGPVVHPNGKFPTRMDYLSHRLDVADFFKSYPHAHAAALCAGGILWRIAVDILPLPDEHKIARAFHPTACIKRTVDNRRYWTPVLTEEEQDEIVGVYKWAGKPNQETKPVDQ